MLKLRRHTGDIDDAKPHVVEASTMQEVVDFFGVQFPVVALEFELYLDTHDPRIGWDRTYLVLAITALSHSKQPVGYSSGLVGELEDVKEISKSSV